MNKVKETVEQILQRDDRARADDKYLVLKTIAEMGYAEIDFEEKKLSIDLSKENMEKIPSFESITRVRRKFQSDKDGNPQYLPPEVIKEEREEREKEMNKINEWFYDSRKLERK